MSEIKDFSLEMGGGVLDEVLKVDVKKPVMIASRQGDPEFPVGADTRVDLTCCLNVHLDWD